MKTFKNIYVIIGFMLFALFFGAANLIYPAFLGIYSGSNLACHYRLLLDWSYFAIAGCGGCCTLWGE